MIDYKQLEEKARDYYVYEHRKLPILPSTPSAYNRYDTIDGVAFKDGKEITEPVFTKDEITEMILAYAESTMKRNVGD